MVDSKKLIGLGIIGIMILSTLALVVVDYASNSGGGALKYNGYKFTLADQQYRAKINGVQRSFIFFPGDIEYVQIPDDVKALLAKPVLTVTYDPNSTLSANMGEAQYYFEVQLADSKIIERAVTNNEGIELPQKSCADATEAQPVIELVESNQSIIKAEGNCIKVQALDAFDLYQETERIVYTILGVMS
jgi:hypothetical protein